MMENNRLEKTFGPSGSFAGIILFIVGLGLIYFSFFGLLLVLIGAFFGFSSTSTKINFDKKSIRFSNNLFGFIRMGEWIDIIPQMNIVIKKSDEVWRSYSRANQVLDIESNDYLLILKDANNSEIMTIKKVKSLDAANTERENLVNKLDISKNKLL